MEILKSRWILALPILCGHASAKRPKQEATWIEEDMIREYTELHNMGITHSIEAFLNGERVGGLYGLAMGEVFFGESMFHTVSNASKVCLVYLTDLCRKAGVRLIDCQVYTQHLKVWELRKLPVSNILKP